MTGAAARCPDRVSCVVVLDGFVARDRRSIYDDFPEARATMEPAFTETPPAAVLPPPAAAFGVEGEVAALLDANSVPMPRSTHGGPVAQEMSALESVERLYVLFTGFPVFATAAEAAASEGWTVHEVEAGHFAPLTDPAAVLQAIGF